MTTLGEVAELISGAGFPLEYQGKSGLEYPFFKVGSLATVEPGQELCDAPDTVDPSMAKTLRAKVIPKNSTVFAKIGMAIRLNRRRLVGVPCCIDNNMMAAVPRAFVEPRFLLRFLETIDLMPITQATTVPSLRRTNLEQIAVPLPPLAEQKRIVAKVEELLARVNAARERLARVPAILKRFRQSILAAACSGRLTADWREASERECDWPKRRLADLGHVTGGITKNPKREKLSVHVPYLRVANVYENRLELSGVLTIGVTREEFDRTQLVTGDLLFVEGNGSLDQIGRVALWDGSISRCVHQNHIIKFRGTGSVLPSFVLYWMMSPQGRAQLIDKASSTSGLHTLSISKIADIEMAVPTLGEQQEIASRVNRLLFLVDKIETHIESTINRVGQATRAILAKAFLGELVPTEAELARAESRPYEPASALLTGIRAHRDFPKQK